MVMYILLILITPCTFQFQFLSSLCHEAVIEYSSHSCIALGQSCHGMEEVGVEGERVEVP